MLVTTNRAWAQHLVDTASAAGYRQARILPDGSVAATLDLLFTRAICLGLHEHGWTRRFCFKDRALADQRFAELTSEDDEPAGFVARRPE